MSYTQWLAQLTDSTKHDIPLLEKACAFVANHPLTEKQSINMADILISWGCDDTVIAASILYPALSKDPALLDKASKQFDKTIIKMIRGASQMEIIHRINASQADALRKMMLAMVDDIRTVLLKLSERLFLISTLSNETPDMQKKIAQETMDYYAPLANRLGLGDLKIQLEDGAFACLHPEAFKKINDAFQLRQADRKRIIDDMIDEIKKMLIPHGIREYAFSGRVKHLYSIYKKINRKQIDVENIYDASALRVIVPSIEDCYTVLSLVHAQWKPIPEEFDDYIAKPKPNGYQSIHTAVLRSDNTPIEIQIRTKAMHERAELGVAAHWKYKENKQVQDTEAQKIHLLRELLDWQKNTLSQETNTDKLYRDAFHDRVYVFSPNGEVFDLQQGATPLDFAYLVHTNIGHRCRGAKVNGALVPLTYTLHTGDHIDIQTIKEGHPSHDWIRPELGYLKTQHAIRKVKLWYRKQDYEKNLADGAALWEKACRQHNYQKSDLQKILDGFNLQNTDTLLAALGASDIALDAIIQKLESLNKNKTADDIIIEEKSSGKRPAAVADFSVAGAKHLLTQLAQCCNPIPGDLIIGYITKGRGISVHQKKCRNMTDALKNKPERLIDITWENTKEKSYRVNLDIESEDRSGLLRDITALIAQLNLSIVFIQTRTSTKNNMAYIALTLDVKNLSLLEDIVKKIRQIEGVFTVKRK